MQKDVLRLILTISDNSEDAEVELWGSCSRCVLAHVSQNLDLERGTCSGKDCTSPPHNNDSRRRSVNATETFAHAPRPDPRDSDELTEAAREVSRFCNGVATTLTAYVKSYMSIWGTDWYKNE